MEKAYEAYKKIPIAMKNMGVDEKIRPYFSNYVQNLILVMLNDEEFREAIFERPLEVIQDLKEM